MPTIRVDDDVFRAHQAKAQPFVDTPNSVLRRLLGFDDSGPRPSGPVTRKVTTRVPRGTSIPQYEFRRPILVALAELQGRAPSREVLNTVRARIQDRLTDVDRSRVPSGEIRWLKKANWEAYKMQRDGLVVKDSGVWGLTDEGWKEARAAN